MNMRNNETSMNTNETSRSSRRAHHRLRLRGISAIILLGLLSIMRPAWEIHPVMNLELRD